MLVAMRFIATRGVLYNKIHRATFSLSCPTNQERQSGQPHDQRATSTTSNEENLKVFRDNASKWWTGKEFSILRSMNRIRVPLITNGIGKPMSDGPRILDVGCGGGILSEALARLGGNVLGIDPVFESINEAQLHAQLDPNLGGRLKYRNCNIEDLSSQQEHYESYDALVASEVLEHIRDVEQCLFHCTRVIKPNGSLFITTINQTPLSWLQVIFFGEHILKQLPKGTHTYDMFVNIKGLRVMLERLGYQIRLTNGFMYEPVGGNFYWTPTTLTHYAIQAIKTQPLAKGINLEQRRYMAKAKSKSGQPLTKPKTLLDTDDLRKVVPIDKYTERADQIVNEFREHLEKGVTIRASMTALESTKVELKGLDEPLELRDIAQISIKGSNLIVINLSSMPEAIKPTLKALTDLGNFDPQVEVNNIYIPMPRVTRDHREKLVEVAKKSCQSTREKLRSLLSEFLAIAKGRNADGPRKGISEDLVRDVEENLRFDSSKRMQIIDQVLKAKIDQLLNINPGSK